MRSTALFLFGLLAAVACTPERRSGTGGSSIRDASSVADAAAGGDAAADAGVAADVGSWPDASVSDAGPTDATAPVDPELLDHALSAARWMEAVAEGDDNQRWWPEEIGEPSYAGPMAREHNLYGGTAGVGLFFARLANVTGRSEHRDLALAAARRLVATATPARGGLYWEHEIKLGDGSIITYDSHGLYNGAAGVGAALLEIGRRFGTGSELTDAAEGAGRWLLATARRDQRGCRWLFESTDIIAGNAGIILFLLDLHRATGNSDYLDGAKCAGDWLRAVGSVDGDAMTWPSDAGGQRIYTGFSHGVAGIAYALAALYEATNDADYLAAAVAGARWLQDRADCDNLGCRWFQYTPGTTDSRHTGWCHGVAGTARLFVQLHRITGEVAYLELAERAARWGMQAADPDRSGANFWGLSLCCGAASVGEFYVDLHLYTGDADYLQYARRVAQYLIGRAHTDATGTRWTNYDYPDDDGRIWFPTGLKLGTPGAAWFLLRVARIGSAVDDWPMLADERF